MADARDSLTAKLDELETRYDELKTHIAYPEI